MTTLNTHMHKTTTKSNLEQQTKLNIHDGSDTAWIV